MPRRHHRRPFGSLRTRPTTHLGSVPAMPEPGAEQAAVQAVVAAPALPEATLADRAFADRAFADRDVADRDVADRDVADRDVADRDVARPELVGLGAGPVEQRSERRFAVAGDLGMATAEYAVATLAACGFAGLLLAILRSGEVRGLLVGIVRRALSVG